MDVAAERIERLHDLARAAAADGDADRARYYVRLARRVAERNRLTLPSHFAGSRVTGVTRISGREPTLASDYRTATSSSPATAVRTRDIRTRTASPTQTEPRPVTATTCDCRDRTTAESRRSHPLPVRAESRRLKPLLFLSRVWINRNSSAAHTTSMTVWVGKSGIDAVVDELDDQLDDRDLVKVKFCGPHAPAVRPRRKRPTSPTSTRISSIRGHTAVLHR